MWNKQKKFGWLKGAEIVRTSNKQWSAWHGQSTTPFKTQK